MLEQAGGSQRVPVLVRLRAIRPGLTPAEGRVAELVLEDPSGVSALTITQLAVRAATSETSVLRFARRLGFKGYPGLRLALAEAGAQRSTTTLRDGAPSAADSAHELVDKVTGMACRALTDTARTLDPHVLADVAAKLAGASRIVVYGAAASSLVACDLQLKLVRLGLPAISTGDRHLALMNIGLLDEGDVAIAVSHTGTTSEAVAVLESAAARGADTVAITNFPGSPVARAAASVLTTAVEEAPEGAMASRLPAMMLVECLYFATAALRPAAGTAG